MSAPEFEHDSVLKEEVLQILNPAPGMVAVDATLGYAGHSLALLSKIGVDGILIGYERDMQMMEVAKRRIEAAHVPSSRCQLLHADHRSLAETLPVVLADRGISAIDLFLADLGPSTPQLLDPERGMSWTSEAPLDMRMDRDSGGETAADIVNGWDEAELAAMIRDLSDERWAKRIAQAIVRERGKGPIRTGKHLGEIVAGAIPRKAWPPKTHPATRVFLALRIEVNREFETLDEVMPAAFKALKPGGRMAIITFHSGEDRRVKRFMRRMCETPRTPGPLPDPDIPAPARDLTRKPIGPGEAEIERNPRARSAKLRAIEKNARA